MGGQADRDAACTTSHSSFFDVPALTAEMQLTHAPRRDAAYVMVVPNNVRAGAAQIKKMLSQVERDFHNSGGKSRTLILLPTADNSPFPQVPQSEVEKDFRQLFPENEKYTIVLAKESVQRPRCDFVRYFVGSTLDPPPKSPFLLYKLTKRERVFVPSRPAELCETFELISEDKAL